MSLRNGCHPQGAQHRELTSPFTRPTAGGAFRQEALTQDVTCIK